MSIRDLHRLRKDYRNTDDSYAHELRLSFAEVVIDRLRQLGWTQKALSEKLGVTEPLVSRLINGDHNWSSNSAGRVLFALGVRARVYRQDEMAVATPTSHDGSHLWFHAEDGTRTIVQLAKESEDGQKSITLRPAETI